MADIPAARVNDPVEAKFDTHGGPCCPHQVKGLLTTGSGDVYINGRPAARVGDRGVHAACCGPNTFVLAGGAATVLVNGSNAVRRGDPTLHCGGSSGEVTDGSPDVFVERDTAT